MTGTILVVDDQEAIRHFLSKALQAEGHSVQTASCAEEARHVLSREGPDIALVDLKLPDANGLDLMAEMREALPSLQVVIITAFGEVETAVEAMKRGAYDYIAKPVHLDELGVVIRKALATKQASLELSHLREARGKELGLDFVETRNARMLRVLEIAREVARSETTSVLIEGESGTGKEVVANLIHRAAAESGSPFLEINCASLPEKLLESELFGHERGAFTDATSQKKGLLELTDGGTLFLDEVGEMSQAIQVKLLRVLERMTFKRVGGVRDIQVRVRVISATNRDLDREVAAGRFRQDLYYRLKVVPLRLPPLRERREDILPLANHFRTRFNRAFGKSFASFSPGAERVLLEHPWPGNIRELKNLLERTILLERGERIEERHLSLEPVRGISDRHPLLSGVECLLSEEIPSDGVPLEKLLEELERLAILKASEQTGWNQSRASALLGMNRDKLRYRMKVYGIHREDSEERVAQASDSAT
jgi:DNA-binding NtrC family response regulator